MMTRVRPLRLFEGLAVLLGHASVLWGVGVALMYFTAAVVLVSHVGTNVHLSLSLPGIGMAGAVLSALIGRLSGEGPPRSAWVAGLLNLLAALAAVGLLVFAR